MCVAIMLCVRSSKSSNMYIVHISTQIIGVHSNIASKTIKVLLLLDQRRSTVVSLLLNYLP